MKNSPSKKLTPLPKLLQKAQILFNAHVRERDGDDGCISCNGQVQQAGHYLSQGHHSALRFGLPGSLAYYNTNGQCVACNMFKHGNLVRYRQGLIVKYGPEIVEQIENAESSKKWSRDELEEIISFYKKSK